MYTKSEAVSGRRPAVYPAEAGKVIVADCSIEAAEAELAIGALTGLVILPARCVPIEFTLILDDLDTGTALTQTVGVLNDDENDIVGGTEMIVETTTGQGGGVVKATALPIVPADAERVIAVKSVTGGVLPVKATAILNSSGVDVTAADTVTVNGKAYTFRGDAPDAEGEVAVGGTAALTLANLKLAINRTDPTTNDGVKYKVAAAHTTVAATTITATDLTLEAIAAGAGGNAYTLTKSAVTLTVPALEFDGGVTAVPLQGGHIRGILKYRAEEYGA
jgi:hypothetical protein